MAAQLAGPLFGLTVNAMTVWRAVQRLGEAAAHHTEALGAYHADARSTAPDPVEAPAAVVVAVDGCMLGMQVRTTRRRRRSVVGARRLLALRLLRLNGDWGRADQLRLVRIAA